jgi:hypothetical protein
MFTRLWACQGGYVQSRDLVAFILRTIAPNSGWADSAVSDNLTPFVIKTPLTKVCRKPTPLALGPFEKEWFSRDEIHT